MNKRDVLEGMMKIEHSGAYDEKDVSNCSITMINPAYFINNYNLVENFKQVELFNEDWFFFNIGIVKYTLNVKAFQKHVKNQEKNKNQKSKYVDFRKSPKFKLWALSFLQKGDIIQLFGTKSSPYRKIQSLKDGKIIGMKLVKKLDKYVEKDILTSNGIEKISKIMMHNEFIPIKKVYEDCMKPQVSYLTKGKI